MNFRKIFGVLSSFTLTIISIYNCIPETVEFKSNIMIKLQEHVFYNLLIFIVLACFGVLTVVALLYDLYKEHNIHSFKYGSKKFYNFFEKWYSQKGTLTIICEDIDWTISDDKKNERIFNALKNKAINEKLNIIINQPSMFDLDKKLEQCGAKIYKAPEHLVGSFSFSCLSQMNNNSIIIVRKKDEDKGKITFRDINNVYVTELLNNLINTIKTERIYESKN